ncbi:MAG TPA: aminoglycoside phosphotransferase family protein [Pseudonocardiaceae bacterium]
MLPEQARLWLAEVALPGAKIVGVTSLSGGYSNENLLLTTGHGERYVLRRYLRPNASRTCAVEAALAHRLRGHVPVAEVVAAAPDDGLLLSEFVPGELAGAALTGGIDPGGLGTAVRQALTAIGEVTFDGPGWFTDAELVPATDDVPGDLAGFVADCLAKTTGLSTEDRRDMLALARSVQPRLDTLAGHARLVHCDYNPKNIMVRRAHGTWVVSAVLDWEFAMSGCPLIDVGNMRRFRSDYPLAFNEAFAAGLADHELADADALDLFALADLLTRPPESALFDRVVRAVRERLREWR